MARARPFRNYLPIHCGRQLHVCMPGQKVPSRMLSDGNCIMQSERTNWNMPGGSNLAWQL
eukprot:1138531-Pelagomonas_calceolata.AAC.14